MTAAGAEPRWRPRHTARPEAAAFTGPTRHEILDRPCAVDPSLGPVEPLPDDQLEAPFRLARARRSPLRQVVIASRSREHRRRIRHVVPSRAHRSSNDCERWTRRLSWEAAASRSVPSGSAPSSPCRGARVNRKVRRRAWSTSRRSSSVMRSAVRSLHLDASRLRWCPVTSPASHASSATGRWRQARPSRRVRWASPFGTWQRAASRAAPVRCSSAKPRRASHTAAARAFTASSRLHSRGCDGRRPRTGRPAG